MGLIWPGFLLLLGLIPLAAAVYIWVLRRRRRFAVRYSSLLLVREAQPHRSSLRRHLPMALFLLGLACLVIALSRPVATMIVPAGQTSVILAMDVSRSMCSTDISPNRLEAAKDAARSYIERQAAGMQIGIVAFAGFAELIQMPTSDQEVLEDAVSGLTTGRRTAIGSAILKSLDTIAEFNGNIPPSSSGPGSGEQPQPLPEGTYLPDIIVLLTDGASNSGPLPVDAAQQAADRGIRIYTIGFGTASGGMMDCGDGFWGGGFGGGSGFGGDPFGGGFRRGIDEPTLKQVAAMTGGEYYSAESADELQKVFRELPTYLITKTETTEISILFTAAGALLAALAIALSLLWHPLP
jgi:Ca-activated chloride channel family protein